MRKLMILIFASLFIFVACSSSDSGNNNAQKDNNDGQNTGEETGGEETDDIIVWAWDPKFNIAALNLAVDAYENDGNEISLEIYENAQDDIVQKLNTTLGSGTTTGLPNIALIEDYRAHSFLQAFPDAFYPLTDVFNPDDFAEYKIAPTSFDGVNYGLPFDTGVSGLYVRTDYLEEAGYTVDDVTDISWSEYIEIGKKVKEVTGKDFMSNDPSDLGMIRIMMQSAGGWYVEEDGVTPDLANNTALKASLEVYKEIIEADIIKPHSDWNQFLANFNNGDVASIVTGNWITPSVKAEESQAGNWAIVPIPTLDHPEAANASNLGGSSWYVLNLPGAEKAADFLGKTFGSNTDFYQDLLTEVGAIGTYKPASEGDAYLIEDDYFQGQPVYADFAGWMEDVPSVNYGMHTYIIDDIVTVGVQDYLNGKDLDEMLEDAQQQAEAQVN